MKLIEKIDNALYAGTSRLVVRWVKKSKYTNHKYDFFIALQSWRIAYWFGIMMFLIYRGSQQKHLVAAGIAVSVMFLVIATGEFFNYLLVKSYKDDYDEIFATRKNPAVYKAVKMLCELARKKRARVRHIALWINLGVIVLLAISNPLLVPVILFDILWIYHECIFDFEDPEKKDKKEKATLTELVAGRWRELTRQLSPQAT